MEHRPNLGSSHPVSDDIIYRITHDLSAEMRSLSQLSLWIGEDLIESGVQVPAAVKQHISAVQDRARRLQSMLRDLTIYARVGCPNGTPFDGDWDRMLARLMADIPNSDTFQIDPCWQVVPQIAELDIYYLLHALVGNAVAHHDVGRGTLRIAARASALGVVIEVIDDGPGIPGSEWQRLCGVLTSTLPPDAAGHSGMGLAIANRIAMAYGGALTCKTGESGRGCHITVDLCAPPHPRR